MRGRMRYASHPWFVQGSGLGNRIQPLRPSDPHIFETEDPPLRYFLSPERFSPLALFTIPTAHLCNSPSLRVQQVPASSEEFQEDEVWEEVKPKSKALIEAIEGQLVKEAGWANVLLSHSEIAASTASMSSVLFSTRPITLFITKPWGRAICLVIAIVCAVVAALESVEEVRIKAKYCRLSVAREDVSSADIIRVGLTLQGWPIDSAAWAWNTSGIFVEALTDSAVWDGVYIEGSTSITEDILEFSLHYRDTHEANWEFETRVDVEDSLSSPRSDLRVFNINRNPIGRSLVVFGLVAQCLAWTFVAAVGASHSHWAKGALCLWCLYACISVFLSWSIGFPFKPFWDMIALLSSMAGIAILVTERWVKTALVLFFMFGVLKEVFESADDADSALTIHLVMTCLNMIPIITIFSLIVLRRRANAGSLRLLYEDRNKYEAAFSGIVLEEWPHLRDLKAECQSQQNKMDKHYARQYNRQSSATQGMVQRIESWDTYSVVSSVPGLTPWRASFMQSKGFEHGDTLPGTRDANRPIKCLSQLFSQAKVVQVHSNRICKRWAASNNGILRSTEPPGYIKWNDARHDEEFRAKVAEPKIKSEKRAIESKFLQPYVSLTVAHLQLI